MKNNKNFPLGSSNIPRLCGYHLALFNRMNQYAVLDSDNCELCRSENSSPVDLFTDNIYEQMITNDEMWIISAPGKAMLIYDLPLYDV